MNRRDFLTALLAIGGAAAVPFNSAEAASDAPLDQAWSPSGQGDLTQLATLSIRRNG